MKHPDYYEEGHPLKKQVLSTSVIALGVALAAPASAQDWDVSWGGYYSAHIGFTDLGGVVGSTVDNDGLGFFNTSEIIFSPSVTLDNGLTFGVNIQMEGSNSSAAFSGSIDETYMTISGDSLGTIIIGAENSAGYKSMVAAPEVTSMYINSPSVSAFIPMTGSTSGILPGGFRRAQMSAYTEVFGNNDVNRITYFTPDFNGLTLGVSYARNNGGNAVFAHNNNNNATIEDIFDIGASYSGTFGTTSVTLGARWGTADVVGGGGDVSTWGIGAQIGFGAFTIGGSYAENDNGTLAGDQMGWSFGATYDAAGPWSFEAVTYQGEADNIAGVQVTESELYKIGARRAMGPGVSWDIYAVYGESDRLAIAGTDVEGTLIGTAINLSF
jgi:predicted porin